MHSHGCVDMVLGVVLRTYVGQAIALVATGGLARVYVATLSRHSEGARVLEAVHLAHRPAHVNVDVEALRHALARCWAGCTAAAS